MPENDPLGNPYRQNDDKITVSIDGVELGTVKNVVIKEPLDAIHFEIRRATLGWAGKKIAEDFEYLWKHSRYDSETLYRVFTTHGSGARDIIEKAIETKLPACALIWVSDQRHNEDIEDLIKHIEAQPAKIIKFKKKEKLPKKLRNGWK